MTSLTSDRPVDARADRYVEEAAVLHPVLATFAGVPGYDDRLPDLSPDGFAAREELDRQVLADVRDAAPVDERERVAQEAFVERLTLTVEMADAGIPRSELSVTASELHDLRGVFDLMPTEGEEAMAAIDARLAGVAEALAGYRVTLLESADRGRVSAKRQLREIAGQIRRWTGQEGTAGDMFKNLVASLDAEGALAGSLERHAAEASAAVAGFGTFLTDELGPARPGPGGGRPRGVRAAQSRYFLGADDRPRRDLRVGLGRAQRRIERDGRDAPT